MQVPAVADRIEIAARRAHAAAPGNRRLTHRDAFLAGAFVIRVVPDDDLRRRGDDLREMRIGRSRCGDTQRALTTVAATVPPGRIAWHAVEQAQDPRVALATA